MSISVVDVSQDEVNKVLGMEESHFVELKSTKVLPSKATRALSAFANSDGGELYIGIDETGDRRTRTWNGFASQEHSNGHIQALDRTSPLGAGVAYEFLRPPQPEAGLVLRITVQKTAGIMKASDGTAYIRRGAQSIKVETPEAFELLQRNKGLTSFESETVVAPLELVENSEVVIGFMLEVVAASEPLPWLRKQLLVQGDKPTVAAILLFSDEPQVVLPKRSAIKIYRYKTTDPEGSRENLAGQPITIEGCLINQIGKAVRTTVDVVQNVKILGSGRLEEVSYPEVTLHEIITNAVLHRDYSVADDVHVRIFDNRIEVESPGRLPGNITEENILRERLSRNGAIVRFINKFPNPPNKDVGEGLNTAFAAMKKLSLRDPIVRQSESSVVVEIRHERLGSPEEIIMQYLDKNNEIVNKKVRELTGIGSENRVKRIFYGLQKNGLIERVPDKNGSTAAWRKCAAKEALAETSGKRE